MAISALVTLMGVWFAALASPGPDVMQIIRLGTRSTRAAVWAALGSTTGLAIWTVASLAGLSALITAHPGILVALQVLGGGYLLWMAYTAITDGFKERRAPATVVGTETRAPLRRHLCQFHRSRHGHRCQPHGGCRIDSGKPHAIRGGGFGYPRGCEVDG